MAPTKAEILIQLRDILVGAFHMQCSTVRRVKAEASRHARTVSDGVETGYAMPQSQ